MEESDESDKEYEEIDIQRTKAWLPGKRPPIPVPGGVRADANPYSSQNNGGGVAMRPGILRAQSLQEAPAPPLPPPNQRHQSPQRASRPTSASKPVPPLPATKPRSATVSERSTVIERPPIRPPKPGESAPVVPKVKRRIEDDFNIESEELNPERFLSKHRDALPLHVRVSKGFYGNSERTSVSEGDTFNIHFIKNYKVVCLEDGGGGAFKIALNSGIEFGILYDPNDNRDEAMNGYTFNKVADMLKLSALPKVVRSGSAWRGANKESTIEKNELLILKGWKRKMSGKFLKAYNPVSNEKKELAENCIGKFFTRSYDTRLFLSDMMEHVPHPLPCKAVLYTNCDTNPDVELPNSLISAVIHLKALTTETTLIATSANFEDYDEDQAVEIPFDLDIDFQVMRPKQEKDTEDLYQTTRKLLENYAKLKSSQYLASDSALKAQSALYSIVREGKELAGVDIVKPTAIYLNTPPSVPLPLSAPPPSTPPTFSPPPSASSVFVPLPSAPPYNRMSGGSDMIYDECDESAEQFSSLHTRIDNTEKQLLQLGLKMESLGKLEETATKVSRDITSARADMKRMETRTTRAGDDASSAKEGVAELKPMVEDLLKRCESMQKEIQELKQGSTGSEGNTTRAGYMALSHTSPISAAGGGANGIEALQEMNKRYLEVLDFSQVMNLLDVMGLSQHHAAFAEERVTGEILLECDDTVLREELKVTSKLQRVRLLKVIQGRHSVEMMLNGEDPYSYAKPK